MLTGERQATIVDRLDVNGSVPVKDLAERSGVTEDGIRKELTFLQKKRLFKNTCGRAVQVRVHNEDRSASQRIRKDQKEKIRIAQKAMGVRG